MSDEGYAAILYFLPALVWGIIAAAAWRDHQSGRAHRTPLRLTFVSGLMALHYALAMLAELVPTDLGFQAPGLQAAVQSADALAIVLGIAVYNHRGPNGMPHVPQPRGRSWLAANYTAAGVVLAAVVTQRLVPTEARWLAWFYATVVTLLYCIIMTGLMLSDFRRRVRRGRWRPGGLAMPRSMDVTMVAGALLFLGLSAAMIVLSFGLGLSRSAGWMLHVFHVGLGLTFAVVPAVRILGEVVRRFLLVAALIASTAAVYFGVHALSLGLAPEAARLLDVAAVLALVFVIAPGQRLLRDAIDRALFRRGHRQAAIQAFVRTLSPELGALECSRRALAEIARVMPLRGAAIVLRDGEAVAHGTFALAKLVPVWPRGALIDALPAHSFDGVALDDSSLREALVEAEVVAVVPLVSPRQRWGHLFITTGLLRSPFIDEDEEIVAAFADQLARVLDGADLLARALGVERALAHAEKLAAIGELAARIAHDIRNPVTAARSLAQQLSHEPDSPLNAEHAALILTELQRVERQIASLLRFARRDELRLEPVDLGDLVRSTVEDLRARLDAAGIRVELVADGGVMARGDREKLRQVLINLIENALDALAEAASSRALAIAVGQQNGAATIRVRDTGAGVPAEALPRLFEPFFSLKEKGTGLGLAIVRRTIEAHGGRVEASSAPGVGLTVHLELPLDSREEGDAGGPR